MARHALRKPARTRFAAVLSTTVVGSAALLAVLATTTSTGMSLAASQHPQAKGNNGTIKIDDSDFDGTGPANHPHVACTFAISWWGFDAGDDHTTVGFDVQAPSGHSGTYPNTQGSLDFHFTGSGPGSTLDHVETYTLDPTGYAEQPNQGFHAKVIVTTSTSNGNDTKSKVFWFGPCAAPSPSPSPSVSESPSPSPSPSPSASETPSPSPSVSQSSSPADPGTPSPTTPAATQAVVPSTVVEATVATRKPATKPVTLPKPVKVEAVKHTRKTLAYTGANVPPLIALALALISAGVILVRRRQDA